MSIVPRPPNYKPKGLDTFNPDDFKHLLERATELSEQQRTADQGAAQTVNNASLKTGITRAINADHSLTK